MGFVLLAAVVSAVAGFSDASATVSSTATAANPIRKIVTLMQNMQKEISAEGAKEKELFDKFMCFCGSSSGDLEKAAADSRVRIEELTAKLKGESAEKTQTAQDLIQHKKDRESATHDLKESAGIREKENAEFQATEAESKTNLDAMGNAIASLEKGMGGAAFMQLPHGIQVHRLVETYPNIDADDRASVLAFLDEGQSTSGTGAIVGVLKQMQDEMTADLKQATSDESQSLASFQALKASKEEEVALASKAIEAKTARSGELAVSVVQTQDALEDEEAELKDSEKFTKNLEEQCATKQKEWDERSAMRNSEIEAISEAIKILNDDDALDVFKKAIPSAASAIQTSNLGFLQRARARAAPAHKALALIEGAAAKSSGPLRLMFFTLSSKLKVTQRAKTENFDAIVKMVDNMIALLGKQQAEDDKQREYCMAEFDKSDDDEKAAKTSISDLEATIAEISDAIQQVTDEISALAAENQALDKSVAQATEQRKEEHSEYASTLQMNDVAKQLVAKAKNRLQKFYQPSLYKAPPTTTESSSPYGLLQLSSRVAQPAAPETFSGDYKKSDSSAGVLSMMDTIINDLDKDTQELEMEEKTAQKDYNTLMTDSQQKRAENSESITSKEADKAELETKLETTKQNHRDAEEDLRIVQGVINDLHRSCDFLLQNYEVRQNARTAETDSLKNANSVLSGANFGL